MNERVIKEYTIINVFIIYIDIYIYIYRHIYIYIYATILGIYRQ